MTRWTSRNRKRKARALDTLQEKGLTACALGAAMLVVPLFVDASLLMTGLGAVLRPGGWLALALGGVLLGLHQVIKMQQTQSDEQHRRGRSGTGTATRRHRQAQTAAIEPIGPQSAGNVRRASRSAKPSRPSPSPRPSLGIRCVRSPAATWSTDVFAAIEWRRFESVCEALFAQAGFETRALSHGADGGVDIWLHSRNSASAAPVAVVQCKHWQGRLVGVTEMREFFGVMASHQLKRGTYATTSQYTPDAQAFAKANGINALDGSGLLKLIATRTDEQQQALLDVAFEGDYGRPTCASCGIKLVERTPSKGGANFWGCSNYPRCKSRLPKVVVPR